MHPAISRKRDEIAELCRQYGVSRLEAFGSAARGADFDPARSDADFMVEFVEGGDFDPLEQFFGFGFALEAALGRKVDLIERGARLNPYLSSSIERDLETIYES